MPIRTAPPVVTEAEKARLFAEVTADERYKDYLYGCYECGICVAVCPSARFYEDFRVTEGGQSVSEELKIFYRLDVRTAGGSYQLVVSPSEHHWSVEEVAASRSFAEELARRLNTELECEDRR